jgi:dTDP-4-dehydrorhamnose 3,5-epimerase
MAGSWFWHDSGGDSGAPLIFSETDLSGAFLIEPEYTEDERGFFARIWCRREFADNSLSTELVQSSISFNKVRGTLRGMHYQAAPYAEDKLVRCTRGSIHDVIIDLRPDSPTFLEHAEAGLTADNRMMIYVPKGFAHGFLTLEDATEVTYSMSEYHELDSARGVRWNDRAFGIEWPDEVRVISDRDRAYPDFNLP